MSQFRYTAYNRKFLLLAILFIALAVYVGINNHAVVKRQEVIIENQCKFLVTEGIICARP